MSNPVEQKLAVLIDADNASKGDLKAILEEIAKYGTPTIKRAYGDWAAPQLAGWKDILLENGAVPVQQYAYTTGKNATDAAMIIDAMDFLHEGRVDGFVLISSDSDFTPLALRLRESGLKVYGIGEKKHRSRSSRPATSSSMWISCVQFCPSSRIPPNRARSLLHRLWRQRSPLPRQLPSSPSASPRRRTRTDLAVWRCLAV